MSDTPERQPKVVPNTLEKQRRWLEENRHAFQAYNLRVAEHGLMSDHGILHGEAS